MFEEGRKQETKNKERFYVSWRTLCPGESQGGVAEQDLDLEA